MSEREARVTQPTTDPVDCSDCNGRGFTIHADPLRSGEPGEPYQVPCSTCDTLGMIRADRPPEPPTLDVERLAQAMYRAWPRTFGNRMSWSQPSIEMAAAIARAYASQPPSTPREP